MTARPDRSWHPAIRCGGHGEQLTLDDAAAGHGLAPAFQPIVSLPDQSIVGFEALARWPRLRVGSPDTVFRHAIAAGAVDALDQLCMDAAIAAVLESGLRRRALLCLNTEPGTPYVRRADHVLLARAQDEFSIMFEITERSVLAHPRALLRKVAALRADGFAVALDDVGAQPDSLLLLDVVLPDVIKLDMALVQSQPSHGQARTLDAVLAHQERTGVVILAEGIETTEHLEQALAVGASLGQGFLFGRPGPLDCNAATTWVPASRRRANAPDARSPFDLVAGSAPVRTAPKRTLTALSRNLEDQAARAADPPMVFTALQRDEYFAGITRQRYQKLAAVCPLVAVFGEDIPTDLGSGIRGISLEADDPLCAEWTVVCLGPHNASALIAREHADNQRHARADGDRRFDYVITHDRSVVTAAVRGLLDRMA